MVGDRDLQADGFIAQAGYRLFDAREAIKSGRYASAIQASQESIELHAKGLFLLRNKSFPPKHSFSEEEFLEALKGLPDDEHLNLTRVYLLLRFWGEFYETAKYGVERMVVSARDLFHIEEAQLAVTHAEECQRTIIRLRVKLETARS